MRELAHIVAETVRRHGLFGRGQRILLGVSGGCDSMVLLHVLHEISKDTAWRLGVAHLNHRLRGKSSDADERLVRRTAKALKLPFFSECVDVRKLSREGKISIEMAARKARHEFLARAAGRCRSGVVALAHHADDQVELFFLRLLRGSGGQGLAGMKWRNPSPVSRRIEIVRPLLEVSRTDLLSYAAENGISFREDASNACQDILRNRIRHQLLPLLKKRYQPAMVRVIHRTGQILGAEAEFAEQAAGAWLRQARAQREPLAKGKLRRAAECAPNQPGPFEALHPAVQRRCLQAQLIALGVAPDYELVEKLRTTHSLPVAASLQRTADCAPCLPGEHRDSLRKRAQLSSNFVSVFRDSGGLLHFCGTPKAFDQFPTTTLTCDLRSGTGTARFDGLRLSWKLEEGKLRERHNALAASELFDADKVGSTIVLRHWQPGDRFQPIGMPSAIKLQDFFTNQKVLRARRHRLAIATTAQGEILWVEGMRISECFKISNKTIRRLQWHWERL